MASDSKASCNDECGSQNRNEWRKTMIGAYEVQRRIIHIRHTIRRILKEDFILYFKAATVKGNNFRMDETKQKQTTKTNSFSWQIKKVKSAVMVNQSWTFFYLILLV